MHNKFIPHIIQAQKEQRLCIFIGAGVSKSSGDMPSWDDLIQELKKDLNTPDETDALKIAQLYYLEFGEYAYYKKLKSLFTNEYSPSLVHHLILELEPEKIITTNWDCLLEKAIDENLHLFDVVASDVDLTKSSLPKKLIKMHGDFSHHNIVFKEEDYLNYEFNFPLITNYIKGIMSSHTIIFIGYSYNDIDLKTITAWIKNNATIRQPLYLLEFKENKPQIKYLENQGISTIVLSEDKYSDGTLDDYSSRVAFFLKNIMNFEQAFVDKGDIDPIDFVYSRLKGLESLDYVLLEQIKRSLGNCSYEFIQDIITLIMYKDIYTTDYDMRIREIYTQFISFNINNKNIPKPQKIKLDKIYEILYSAGINGVSPTPDNISNSDEYVTLSLPHDSELYKIMSFDYSMKNGNNIDNFLSCAQIKYLQEDYIGSLALLERALRLSIDKKNYAKILISSSNYNDVKELVKLRNFDTYDLQPEIINNSLKPLDNYYNSIPIDERKKLNELYHSLDKNILNKHLNKSFNAITEARKKQKVIQNGGMHSSRDGYIYRAEHKNILHYYIGNKLTIDAWSEFKKIIKNYIEASFSIQCDTNKISLNKEEIYSLIKYYTQSELKDLFNEYCVKNNLYFDAIKVNDEDIQWIIHYCLRNLVDSSPSSMQEAQSNWSCIANILFILSFLPHSQEKLDNIFSLIDQAINRKGVWITFYESINHFVVIQRHLYETKFTHNHLKLPLEKLIDKYSKRDANGYETIVIFNIDTHLKHLYNVAIESEVKISNKKSIDRILFDFDDSPLSGKNELASSLLFPIIKIADDNIQKIIINYINDLILDNKKTPTIEGLKLSLLLCSEDFEKWHKDTKNIFRMILKSQNKDITMTSVVSKISYILEHFYKIRKKEIYKIYLQKLMNKTQENII